MKRRILAILLACVMVLSIVPFSVFAEDAVTCPGKGKVHDQTHVDAGLATLVATVAPKCEEAGYDLYKCNTCEDEFPVNFKPATGTPHDVVKVDAVPHTVKEDGTIVPGNREYYECKLCGKKWADEARTEVVLDVSDKEHVFNDGTTVDASCEDGSYTTKTCLVCGYVEKSAPNNDATGHDWKFDHVDTEPTCKSEGKAIYKCANCGATREVKIEPSKHTHNFGEVVERKAATCTETGITQDYYVCSICEKKFNSNDTNTCEEIIGDVVEAALGHDKRENVTKEATCTEEGTKTVTCSRCDYKVEEPIEKKPHTKGIVLVEEKPTCEAKGKLEYICADCGNKITETPDKLEHVFSETKDIPAGCTTWGYTLTFCKNCGMISESMPSIPPTGHRYDEANEIAGTKVEPSCTSVGSVKYTCSKCHEEAVYTIPQLKHELRTVTEESNCKEKGLTYQYCTSGNCGYADAAAYNGKVSGTDMSSTFDGVRWVMKSSIKDLDINPENHVWVKDKIINPATCTEAGQMTTYCEKCAENSTAVIPALGHNFVLTWTGNVEHTAANSDQAKDPTNIGETPNCTESGYLKIKCSRCDAMSDATSTTKDGVSLVLPALGHIEKTVTNKDEANCEGPKVTSVVCERCGTTLSSDSEEVALKDKYTRNDEDLLKHHPQLDLNNTLEKNETLVAGDCLNKGLDKIWCAGCQKYVLVEQANTGSHSPVPTTDNGWGLKPGAATCLANGSDGWYTCEYCHNKVEVKGPAALGHDWKEIAEVKATCTTDGHSAYKECKRCDETEGYETFNALGHDWEEIAEVEATCTTGGHSAYKKCKRCSGTEGYDIINALGHDIIVLDENREATCVLPAYKHIKCERCDMEDVIEKDSYRRALGHDWDEGEKQEATCQVEGGTLFTCERCRETELRDVDAAKQPHQNAAGELLEGVCTAHYTDLTCKWCQEVFAAQHIEEVVTVPATCTEKGYAYTKCVGEGCKAENRIVTAPEYNANPLGHDFTGRVEVVVEATETTPGLMHIYCVRCDKYEEQVIPSKQKIHLDLAISNITGKDAGYSDFSIVEVKVIMSSALAKVRSLSFDLNYDKEKLQLIDLAGSDVFAISTVNDNNGWISFAGMSGKEVEVNEDGAIVAVARFIVIRDRNEWVPGTTDVKFDFEYAQAFYGTNNPITVDTEITDDTITIKPIMDLNDDGYINMEDAMTLYDLILNSEYDVRADIDRNGVIEAIDLQYFFNFFTGKMTINDIHALV